MSKLPTYTATTLMASFIGTFSMTAAAAEQDSFIEALTGGKVSFSARARYEAVEQDNALKDADITPEQREEVLKSTVLFKRYEAKYR